MALFQETTHAFVFVQERVQGRRTTIAVITNALAAQIGLQNCLAITQNGGGKNVSEVMRALPQLGQTSYSTILRQVSAAVSVGHASAFRIDNIPRLSPPRSVRFNIRSNNYSYCRSLGGNVAI